MRFSPSFLDDIRERVPVSEVVGRRVKLRKQGREWRGLSPFNAEKTPSFYVNDQKGFYHCFSSGKHGDQFRFLMETEGVTFPEAVERLAGLAGLVLPEVSPQQARQDAQARTLYAVMDLAAAFYFDHLRTMAGAAAQVYLTRRGLSTAIQDSFRIGYAPASRHALKEHLGSKGVSVTDMIACGLLVHGEDIPVPYDRFRDRVMFPITDLRGRVVAFGGRALEKDVPAKYLNSPETDLFHKGSLLYNAQRARETTQKTQRLIVVEGYVDVIALSAVGLGETVAPLGTALTEAQIDLLWKLAPSPILLFDGDKAGRRAAYRAIDIALPHLKPGRSLSFALLPEGQDPDDLVRAAGRPAIDAVLAEATPLVEVLWQREVDTVATDTPEQRAAFEARIGSLIAGIADESVRRHYRDALFTRMRQMFRPTTRHPLQAQTAVSGQRIAASNLARGPSRAMPHREALMLQALLRHPWLIDGKEEMIADIEFRHVEADRLRHAILEAHAFGTEMPVDMMPASSVKLPSLAADAPEGDVEITFTQLVALHRRQQAIATEIRAAQDAFGHDPSEANQAWLIDAKRREAEIAGTEALIEGFGEFRKL